MESSSDVHGVVSHSQMLAKQSTPRSFIDPEMQQSVAQHLHQGGEEVRRALARRSALVHQKPAQQRMDSPSNVDKQNHQRTHDENTNVNLSASDRNKTNFGVEHEAQKEGKQLWTSKNDPITDSYRTGASDASESEGGNVRNETTGRLLARLTQNDMQGPMERLQEAWQTEETGSVADVHRSWAMTHISDTASQLLKTAKSETHGWRTVSHRLLPLVLTELQMHECEEEPLRSEVAVQLAGISRLLAGISDGSSSLSVHGTYEQQDATYGCSNSAIRGLAIDELVEEIRTHEQRVNSARLLFQSRSNAAARALAMEAIRAYILPTLRSLCSDITESSPSVRASAADALCEVVGLCLPPLLGEDWSTSPVFEWVISLIDEAERTDAALALKLSTAALICAKCAEESRATSPTIERLVRRFLNTWSTRGSGGVMRDIMGSTPSSNETEGGEVAVRNAHTVDILASSLAPQIVAALVQRGSCSCWTHSQPNSDKYIQAVSHEMATGGVQPQHRHRLDAVIQSVVRQCTNLSRGRLFSARLAGVDSLMQCANVLCAWRPCSRTSGEDMAKAEQGIGIAAQESARVASERVLAVAAVDANEIVKLGAARHMGLALALSTQTGASTTADLLNEIMALSDTADVNSGRAGRAMDDNLERKELFCNSAPQAIRASSMIADEDNLSRVTKIFQSVSGLILPPRAERGNENTPPSPARPHWRIRFAATRALPELAVSLLLVDQLRESLPQLTCKPTLLFDTHCSFGGPGACVASVDMANAMLQEWSNGDVRWARPPRLSVHDMMSSLLEMFLVALVHDPIEEVRIRALNNVPVMLAAATIAGLQPDNPSFAQIVDAVSSMAVARHWRFRVSVAELAPVLVLLGRIAKQTDRHSIDQRPDKLAPQAAEKCPAVTQMAIASLLSLLHDEVHAVRKRAASAAGDLFSECSPEVARTFAMEIHTLSRNGTGAMRATFVSACASIFAKLNSSMVITDPEHEWLGMLCSAVCDLAQDKVYSVRLSVARAWKLMASIFHVDANLAVLLDDAKTILAADASADIIQGIRCSK